MVRGLWAVAALALITVRAVPAVGEPKKPKAAAKKPEGKGFWKILVQPDKKWVLKDTSAYGDPRSLVVEPVGIHKVGAATVAHLNWTLEPQPDSKHPDHRALKGTQAVLLNQVAVTDAGLYLLPDDADDAKIAEVLKGKPSRSDPLKPYDSSKLNDGRYLTFDGDIVCMGRAKACDNGCDGSLCISATNGVVHLDGTWSPDRAVFDAGL